MAYLDLFVRVMEHVERRGVRAELGRGPALAEEVVQRTRDALDIPLPASLVALYREMGDGFQFWWIDAVDERVFANVEFPPLDELVAARERARRYGKVFDEGFGWPLAKDPAAAQRRARRMRGWLAFHFEGNGDTFSLDTALGPDPPVVFDQHDWSDSKHEQQVFLASPTLGAFLDGWARVCFQFPMWCWWMDVLRAGTEGIDWQSDRFDPRFRSPPPDGRQYRLFEPPP